MKNKNILKIGGLIAFLLFAILNPLGVCRRHDYLYETGVHVAGAHKMTVMIGQVGWRAEGQLLFLRRSYWGSPYRILVYSGLPVTEYRVANVKLHDEETGEEIALSEDTTWGRGGDWKDKDAWFASITRPLEYHRYTAHIDVEEIASGKSRSFLITLNKNYRSYWAIDVVDALMSV